MLRQLWSRIWIRIIAYLVGSVLLINSLVWVFSPMLSRHFLGDLLGESRLELSQESSVRINLFLSHITIKDLHWQGNKGRQFYLESLRFDFRFLTLFVKELEITSLHINGMELYLHRDDEALSIAGFSLVDEQPGVEQEEVYIEEPQVTGLRSLPLAVNIPIIELNDLRVFIDDAGRLHNLHIKSFRLQQGYANENEAKSALDFSIDLNGANIEFDSALDWQPSGGSLSGKLELQNFVLDPYLYLLDEQEQNIKLSSDLAFTFDLAMPPSDKPQLLEQALKFNSLSLALKNVSATQAPWKAGFDELVFSSENAEFEIKPEDIIIKMPLAMQMKNVSASQLLEDEGRYEQLAQLQSIQFSDALISGNASDPNFSAPNIELDSFVFSKPEDKEAFFTLSALQLKDIAANSSQANLDTIVIKEFKLKAFKAKSGQWDNLLVDIEEEADESEQADDTQNTKQKDSQAESEETASQEADFAFSIKRIVLLENSLIHFHDESTLPIFDLALNLEEMELSQIDNTKPEQMTHVSMQLSDGEYFKQNLSADWQLFHDKPSGKFDMVAKQFPLYKVSPFLKHEAGFDIMAGEMDLDYKGAAELGILDSKAVVLLRGPVFSSGDDDHVKETSAVGQASIPINLALNMLKDHKGNIKLKLSVDGDMTDPEFGFGSVVSLVLKKAILSQARNEIARQFIPYGQLLGVAMMVGTEALKVRFSDLSYIPATQELDEKSASMAEALHQLLLDKPNLDLRLCPVAISADLGLAAETKLLDEQHHQALQMAQQRATTLKANLVLRGIGSERLLLCAARYDGSKDGLARIEIQD
ncbi:DUF748 domain-containing protein [Agaribacterium sp. ZY112]|uniref:DUF748 domain-containing protein n=1 Tax=Agaribacterium sp. ZY112 TaxID=3233574 RepID=UPI003524DBC8